MRQCRERANLSREKLAPKAFIHSSTLEKWEVGERLPTLDKLKHWFDAVDANDWYREKILSLSQPALFELQLSLAGQMRLAAPTDAEIKQLELLPFPACYRSLPTYDLIAANAAFRRTFPGLAVAPASAARPTNIVEWMVLSPLANKVIRDWRRHTHVLVNSLQVMASGVVPDQQLEAIVASCSRASQFHAMWDSDVSSDAIHNTDFTVLDPTRSRWISYNASPYRAATRGSWELWMLTPRV